jgi:hypothetical protein
MRHGLVRESPRTEKDERPLDGEGNPCQRETRRGRSNNKPPTAQQRERDERARQRELEKARERELRNV